MFTEPVRTKQERLSRSGRKRDAAAPVGGLGPTEPTSFKETNSALYRHTVADTVIPSVPPQRSAPITVQVQMLCRGWSADSPRGAKSPDSLSKFHCFLLLPSLQQFCDL